MHPFNFIFNQYKSAMTREEWLRLSAVLGMGAMLPKEVAAAFADEPIKASDFGKNFVWGAATAAYQIEGGWNEDGKGESIWDHMVHKHPGKIYEHQTADVADDFYHRYESDIKLMKQLNIPAFRFSIAWSRILPNGTGQVNQKGIDFYNRVIDTCLKNNIEPWVTCYHWDLPQALEEKGGWTNRDVLGWFEEYLGRAPKVLAIGLKTGWYLTSPWFLRLSVIWWAAMHRVKWGSPIFLRRCTMLHYATGLGEETLRNLLPKTAKIGSTFSVSHIEAWKNKPQNDKARIRLDVALNRLFIEPVLGMGYPVKDLPALHRIDKYKKTGDDAMMAFDFDFIGLQNYFRTGGEGFCTGAINPCLAGFQ